MSEIRQDLVTGDWVIMAPERAKRPHDFLPKKQKRAPAPKSTCPFEDLKKSGNGPVLLAYPNEKNWRVVVVPNKYPALRHEAGCVTPLKHGPYTFYEGIGVHDLVIGRDHVKNIADLSPEEGFRTLEILQKRFCMVADDSCMQYTSAFFNWGPSAGASLYHPHYQVMTLPIIPPSIEQSLRASADYFRIHRRCVHCDIIAHEVKNKMRVVDQSAGAVALTPFVPRGRFEISIYPKKHHPFFEHTPARDLRAVALMLRSVLRRVRKRLNDPDLNFFIHTSPLRHRTLYEHYHWHIDVMPKILIPAGFELSTGVDINIIDPDWLASRLRGSR